MGNYLACQTCDITGKVILPDGTIHVFDQPIAAGELMVEHPHQFVVEFAPLLAGNKAALLPADQKLETEKVYLMLPMKQGKMVRFSPEETQRILATARLVLGSAGSFHHSLRFFPRLARMCSINVGKEEEIDERRKDRLVESREKGNWPEMLPEMLDQRPEFLSRELSGKGWKPTLDTIKEQRIEKRVSHWLFKED